MSEVRTVLLHVLIKLVEARDGTTAREGRKDKAPQAHKNIMPFRPIYLQLYMGGAARCCTLLHAAARCCTLRDAIPCGDQKGLPQPVGIHSPH